MFERIAKYFGSLGRSIGVETRQALTRAATVPDYYHLLPPHIYGGSNAVPVNENTILGNTAAWRAIKLIGESVARVEKYIKRKQGDSWIRDDNHHLCHLMKYPAEYYSHFVFYETLIGFALLYGNSYAYIRRNPMGYPEQLLLLHPSHVRPQYYNSQYYSGYSESVWNGDWYYEVLLYGGSGVISVDPMDMIHINSLVFDPPHLMGKDPMFVHQDTFGLGSSAKKLSKDFYENGAILQGYLHTQEHLSEKEAQQIRSSFESSTTASGGFFSTPVLHSGLEYKPVKLTPKDALFVEISTMTLGELSRIFGVPLHMIGSMENGTFSNVEQMSYEFQEYTLEPWCQRVAAEFQRKLVTLKKRYTTEICLDTTVVRSGDFESRAAYYTKLFSVGALSSNDIRKKEGFNPRAGGEVYYTPVNVFSDQERDTREEKNRIQIDKVGTEIEFMESEAELMDAETEEEVLDLTDGSASVMAQDLTERPDDPDDEMQT